MSPVLLLLFQFSFFMVLLLLQLAIVFFIIVIVVVVVVFVFSGLSVAQCCGLFFFFFFFSSSVLFGWSSCQPWTSSQRLVCPLTRLCRPCCCCCGDPLLSRSICLFFSSFACRTLLVNWRKWVYASFVTNSHLSSGQFKSSCCIAFRCFCRSSS